jgi:hypothetical protein
MYEIGVDVVDLETTATCFEGRSDPFRAMVCVPKLRGDEKVFTTQGTRGNGFAERRADRFFVQISLGAVEVAEPCQNCRLHRLFRRSRIGYQCAKPGDRDRASAMGEGDSLEAKHIWGFHLPILRLGQKTCIGASFFSLRLSQTSRDDITRPSL